MSLNDREYLQLTGALITMGASNVVGKNYISLEGAIQLLTLHAENTWFYKYDPILQQFSFNRQPFPKPDPNAARDALTIDRLEMLREFQKRTATIEEAAERFKVSAEAVKHRLKAMQQEGLLTYVEDRYSMTYAGRKLLEAWDHRNK